MRLPRRRAHDDRDTLLPRLDRAFGQLNPLLLAIAMGLVVLDVTCLAAMLLPTNRLTACASPSAGAVVSK